MTTFESARRNLLKASLLLPVAGTFITARAATSESSNAAAAQASFTVKPEGKGRIVSDSLASLSYETGQLADPRFFSPDNHSLIALLRELNPNGVLRIGGNTSDITTWSEYHGTLPAQPSHTTGPQHPVTLRPESLRNLSGFLRATGWKLVFGVNLRAGSPAMAVALSHAVRDAVGDSLLAIQIGNEANNYEKDYADFDTAWQPYARALRAAGMPLAGPDTGANTDWVIAYAREHGAENCFLSRHYYRDAAQRGSVGDLLGGDPGLLEYMERLVDVGDEVHLPVRLTEANSYYFGGRDGVSNVFAAALWGADFMLGLASLGVSGIHFHGGTLTSVEASLGREVHATTDASSLSLQRDAASAHYAPIAGDVALGFQPRPLYHGMVLAQRFAGARMLYGKLDTGGANLAAYAGKRDDEMLLALINKDVLLDADMSIDVEDFFIDSAEQLRAASLDSRDTAGLVATAWQGDTAQGLRIRVPRASALLVHMKKQHV
ncbi:hypothetical protein DWU98_03935 [Dyella monticola]|uniref:Beta-glucuronidase C-terminal domain-containing protein n=1 Tax=Dyella monticola TaxID=1927958 RepID=A0A370X4Z7_9GAMM|nr:hypothetical protein [Dyella monticola]RDS83503.1 hypothetical protein DWU98_03935 [Dyella monticola]